MIVGIEDTFIEKTKELEYYKEFAEEQRLDADRFYNIIKDIAVALELEGWTTKNIVKKVEEYRDKMIDETNGL